MATLSRDKVKEIVQKAPHGVSGEDVINGLIANGHSLEGFNDAGNNAVAATAQHGELSPEYVPIGFRGFLTDQAMKLGANPDFQKGIATNEPLNDTTPWYQPTVAGTARALPSVVLSVGGGGPAGAGLGEALRQGLVSANARAGNTSQPTLLDAVGRPAAAATLQKGAEFVGPYVEKAASAVARGLGTGAQAGLRWIAKNLQGVKPASYQYAEDAGASAIRPYLGAGTDAADSLAESARGAISKAIKAGEDAYPDLIQKAQQNPAYAGKTFDLQKALGDKVLEIADKFGYQGIPDLKSAPGSAKFWKFAGQVDNLKNASLDTVYAFQKQLNGLKNSTTDKTLAGAYKTLSGAVRDYIGAEVPEIGQANAQYAAARALDEQTGGLVNKNDLVKHVLDTYRTGRDTLQRQTLENAAAKVPGLGEAISGIRSYGAAQDFAPFIRSLPQTGFGADAVKYALGAGSVGAAGFATQEPVLAAAGAGIAAGIGTALSPRAALGALGMSQAMAGSSQAVGRGAAASLPAAAQAAVSPIAEYFTGPAVPATALANYYKSGGR